MTNRLRLLAWLFAAVFLAAHLRTLPRTLEDIDSINFALGVEDYNVDAHRPHPPGYPVYIALAKIATAAVHVVAPSWDRDRTSATGLALLSAIAGALAIFALTRFWLALGFSPAHAFFAALLAAVSPLFWFTAARPLTDTPGLVAAIAVQAALLRGLRGRRASFLTARGEPLQLSRGPLPDPQVPNPRPQTPNPTPRYWLVAGIAAGFIVGLRSQTMWLTGPLLAWCVWELARRRRMGDALRLVGGAAGGALLWAIPMVWATGGLTTYLNALSRMGSADFSDIEMLSKTPTWALFTVSMTRTFIEPWLRPAIAGVVLLLAMAGAARLLGRRAPAIALIALAFVPYLVFHLLFHETVTGRYGLPLVVPVAGLAVAAMITLRAFIAGVAVAVLAAASLVVVQPAMSAYARDAAPVMRGLHDMATAGVSGRAATRLATHHEVWHGVQRGLLWHQPVWDPGPVPFPGDHEWLDIEKPWLTGDTRTVWLLANVARTDVAVFDPRSRTLRGRYEIDRELRKFTKSLRLDSFNWWSIDRPGWMLGTGWSLTSEIAGVTGADKTAPHFQEADAWILRRAAPVRVLIGGRYVGAFGNANAPPAVLSIEFDGRPVTRWTLPPRPIAFADWLELPATAADASAPYARLTVRALPSAPGLTAPVVQLEQFDAATLDVPMAAFLGDWHEPEQDAAGRQWRWTGATSTIEVKGASRDLTLDLSGESPLKNFESAPQIIVRAGTQELARFQPDADFALRIALPLSALAASGGRVTIETSQTFAPHERDGAVADTRRLGLKLFETIVR